MRDVREMVRKSGKCKNVIWEGRYQPIHVGHLAFIRRLLEFGERVWIWVVANVQSSEVVSEPALLPVPEFSHMVDPHHHAGKNLLPFWLRYMLVVETVRHEFGSQAPILVSGGRRLDLAWDLYRKILPPERVFLTPERDDFEDAKAAAWTKLGERCLRVNVSDLPRISATMIRDRLARRESIDGLLSDRTTQILHDEGYLDALIHLS